MKSSGLFRLFVGELSSVQEIGGIALNFLENFLRRVLVATAISVNVTTTAEALPANPIHGVAQFKVREAGPPAAAAWTKYASLSHWRWIPHR